MIGPYTDEVVRKLLKIQDRLENTRWDNRPPIQGVFMRWDHSMTYSSMSRSDSARLFSVPYFDNPPYIDGGNNPPPCTQLFTAISEHLRGKRVYELTAPGIEVLMQELAIGEIRNGKASTAD